MSHLAAAKKYLNAGLCVLPALTDQKRPKLPRWDEFQKRLPTESELCDWFSNGAATCLVTGEVSGNLESIDFDFKAELFQVWCQLVEAESPGLLDRLVIERSQSGGKHVVYRCESIIPGNLKLAQRNIVAPSKDPIEVSGKKVTPRWNRTTDRYEATIALIETRGEGGLFLCAPGRGYVLESGCLEAVPRITQSEREILIDSARALNEALPPVGNTSTSHTQRERPGDDYNEHGDFRELLRQHGWSHVGGGENEYWRRPGKELGQSATIRGKVFYCFSSNAAPFEADKSYSPFAVYAWLEHGGDFKAAATALRDQKFGNSLDSVYEIGYAEKTEIAAKRASNLKIRTARELVSEFTSLRRPVIEGLLRRGETMNIIAPSKFGKSWLVLDLAISVATGRKWLDQYPTIRGKVLLIDNELHPETTASRIPRVAMARGVGPEEYQDNISIINLRGGLMDLNQLAIELLLMQPGTFDLILLDAWYRFQPPGTDENSNGDVAKQYDTLDSVAHHHGCAFGSVHHSSKGSQAGKSVTDIGSGAGAQSRAADTHLTMIEHEVDGAVVVQSVVRSWAPPPPHCLIWEFPIWQSADHLDPKDVKTVKHGRRPKSTAQNDKADPEEDRQRKAVTARDKVLQAYADTVDGDTDSNIAAAAELNFKRFKPIQADLIRGRYISPCKVEKHGRKYDGFKLTTLGLELVRHSDTPTQNQSESDLSGCSGSHSDNCPPFRGQCQSESESELNGDVPTLEDVDVF